MRPTYVVAEIGSCHEGDLDKAKKLIRIAKHAGADCAKAQFWSSGDRLAARRNAPELAATYRSGEIDRSWINLLRGYADMVGIEFACSTYLPEDVWFVAQSCDVLKVSSFEAEDVELLTAHRGPVAAGKRLIVSLGMGGSTRVVERALEGVKPARVDYLHCVSAYPAPVDQLGLVCLRERFGNRDLVNGFSDHTAHPAANMIGAIAVAAGATIVERHLRLVETPETNPDFAHSSSPTEFRSYVEAIRFAELALDNSKMRTCEEPMKAYRVR